MARLSAAQRRSLSPSDYAVPSKAPGPCSLPIPDRDHAAAALRLCVRCGGGACMAVKRAVCRKFGMGC